MNKKTLKIFIIALFSIIMSKTIAQDTIQQWNIGVYDRNWMPPETTMPFWTTHIYKLIGDTLINNISYKKLYFSEDSLFNNPIYYGAIRNYEKKLYYFKNNNDYLLYNFDLSVNDTALIYRYCGELYPMKVKVISISDTIINNRLLKKYNVSYSDTTNAFSPTGNDNWIEEIGSEMHGLMNEACSPYLTGSDKDFHLLCYKENNNIVFQDTTYNTCFKETVIDDIPTISKNQIKVYPTILTGSKELYLESPYVIKEITIINLQGQKIFHKNINTKKHQTNLHFLKQGMYILKVNNNSFKFIVD